MTYTTRMTPRERNTMNMLCGTWTRYADELVRMEQIAKRSDTTAAAIVLMNAMLPYDENGKRWT